MRGFGKLPTGPMRVNIANNLMPYTIWRENRDSYAPTEFQWGGGTESEYRRLDEPREMFWFNGNEREVQTEAGERREGTLVGRTLTDVDVRHQDRFEYGGARYEIDTIDTKYANGRGMFDELKASLVSDDDGTSIVNDG